MAIASQERIMPGLRPKATPISFEPSANGYHSPTVKSPTGGQTNGHEANKKSTCETEYTQDFTKPSGDKAGHVEPNRGEHLATKDVPPANSPPPKAAKMDSSPPGSLSSFSLSHTSGMTNVT